MQLFTHLLSSYLQGMGDFFSALPWGRLGMRASHCSNAVSVAIPQPRVAGEDRYPGCKYDHYSNAVSVAIRRRRYPHQGDGRKYIGRYYQIEYNAFG